jgi:hypothetical protein
MSQDRMENLGITRTVYSLCYPESDKVLKDLLSQKSIIPMYHDAYSKKQDNSHIDFLNQYKDWSKEVVNVDWDQLKFSYPSNGSSESIREQIAYLKATGVDTMFVFEGEYEGYEAIAKPLNMRIIKVNREEYQFHHYGEEKSLFFISQPSSIDGNIWEGYSQFMMYMLNNYSNIRIYLDLAYVGCVPFKYKINCDYENVDGIFFSLSKAFGVYYHRIGGCFLKKENPLLLGNMWFKNLFAMKYGEKLMSEYSPMYLPNKYKEYKNLVIAELEQEIKVNYKDSYAKVINSDVLLLSNIKTEGLPEELISMLTRGNKESVRVCLTERLESFFKDERDSL